MCLHLANVSDVYNRRLSDAITKLLIAAYLVVSAFRIRLHSIQPLKLSLIIPPIRGITISFLHRCVELGCSNETITKRAILLQHTALQIKGDVICLRLLDYMYWLTHDASQQYVYEH